MLWDAFGERITVPIVVTRTLNFKQVEMRTYLDNFHPLLLKPPKTIVLKDVGHTVFIYGVSLLSVTRLDTKRNVIIFQYKKAVRHERRDV